MLWPVFFDFYGRKTNSTDRDARKACLRLFFLIYPFLFAFLFIFSCFFFLLAHIFFLKKHFLNPLLPQKKNQKTQRKKQKDTAQKHVFCYVTRNRAAKETKSFWKTKKSSTLKVALRLSGVLLAFFFEEKNSTFFWKTVICLNLLTFFFLIFCFQQKLKVKNLSKKFFLQKIQKRFSKKFQKTCIFFLKKKVSNSLKSSTNLKKFNKLKKCKSYQAQKLKKFKVKKFSSSEVQKLKKGLESYQKFLKINKYIFIFLLTKKIKKEGKCKNNNQKQRFHKVWKSSKTFWFFWKKFSKKKRKNFKFNKLTIFLQKKKKNKKQKMTNKGKRVKNKWKTFEKKSKKFKKLNKVRKEKLKKKKIFFEKNNKKKSLKSSKL